MHGELANPNAFSCEVFSSDRGAVVLPRGELDLATAPMLLRTVRSALASRVARLVVDLRHVPFMDSSGIQALNTARLEAAEHGTEFTLTSVPPHARAVLEITGLAGTFDLTPPAECTPRSQ